MRSYSSIRYTGNRSRRFKTAYPVDKYAIWREIDDVTSYDDAYSDAADISGACVSVVDQNSKCQGRESNVSGLAQEVVRATSGEHERTSVERDVVPPVEVDAHVRVLECGVN